MKSPLENNYIFVYSKDLSLSVTYWYSNEKNNLITFRSSPAFDELLQANDSVKSYELFDKLLTHPYSWSKDELAAAIERRKEFKHLAFNYSFSFHCITLELVGNQLILGFLRNPNHYPEQKVCFISNELGIPYLDLDLKSVRRKMRAAEGELTTHDVPIIYHRLKFNHSTDLEIPTIHMAFMYKRLKTCTVDFESLGINQGDSPIKVIQTMLKRDYKLV